MMQISKVSNHLVMVQLSTEKPWIVTQTIYLNSLVDQAHLAHPTYWKTKEIIPEQTEQCA